CSHAAPPPARRPASDVIRQTPPVALHAGADVSFPDHVPDVDPPPHHRHLAGTRWHLPGLVADGDRHRRRRLRIRVAPVVLATGHAIPVRLHPGPGLPPAQRHPPPVMGRGLGLRDSQGVCLGHRRVRGRRAADRTDLVLRPAGCGMSGGGETSRAAPFRTPLKRARGLGAGKSGTDHFWMQRVTAIVLAPLAIWFVWTLVTLVGADLETARGIIARPWNTIIFAVFLVCMFWHAKLGLQIV